MGKTDYAKLFDLKPEEHPLRILICAEKRAEPSLLQAEFIDPDRLPRLPFSDQSFDLVLCPNILFAENDIQTETFIQERLRELVRVSSEVRVLPLVNKEGAPSEHLGSVLQFLQEQGMGVELRNIQAEPGHPSAMLRLWNATCKVKT